MLSNNSNTFLTFDGPVTLTGSGTITMSQAISNGQPVLRNANNGNLTKRQQCDSGLRASWETTV